MNPVWTSTMLSDQAPHKIGKSAWSFRGNPLVGLSEWAESAPEGLCLAPYRGHNDHAILTTTNHPHFYRDSASLPKIDVRNWSHTITAEAPGRCDVRAKAQASFQSSRLHTFVWLHS